MEEEAQNRRLFLAITVCLFVLVAWTFMFPQKPPPEPVDGNGLVAATSTTGIEGAPPEAVVVETASTSVAKRAAVEPRYFPFKGEVEVDDQTIPYEVTLTNVGGGIENFVLTEYFERASDRSEAREFIRLANATADLKDLEAGHFGQAGAISFGRGTTFDVPERLVFDVVEETDSKVVFRARTPDNKAEIDRVFELVENSFEIRMQVTVRNLTSEKQAYRLEISSALKANEAMEQSGGFLSFLAAVPDHLQTQCFIDGGVERVNYQSLEDESAVHQGSVQWVAIDRQYFLGAIIARGETGSECEMMAREKTARAVMKMPLVELAPRQKGPDSFKVHMFDAFFGVKKPSLLSQLNAELEGAIDYTIFWGLNLAPLCTALLWILGILHSLTGSWGISIIGLTMLVKVVLFPLNQRSMKSMRALSALKPEMDKIREKHKGDQQRQNEEMMRLYRENNVNPAGGCLPILLQMPIWIALYRALSASVDLYQQPFLWIADLTTQDPYWVLPILLIVVMFLQQRSMPSSMDPAQQKIMMYTMPLVFGLMISAAPAGLCLYILANTVLTIGQQHLINRTIGPAEGPPSALEAKA